MGDDSISTFNSHLSDGKLAVLLLFRVVLNAIDDDLQVVCLNVCDGVETPFTSTEYAKKRR